MQLSADRAKLIEAYGGAGSVSAVGRCGAALALLGAVVVTGALSADYSNASLLGAREAAKGRLTVEQPGIAHAREVYAGRRTAHTRRNADLLARQ